MLLNLIKTMRPKQWAKSIFIFTALVFDRKLLVMDAFLPTLAGAALFSLIASAVYLFNDLADREADLQHPTKKDRPIASGQLSAQTAWAAGIILLVLSLPLAYLLSPWFLAVCVIYFILNLSYSAKLKHIPLIDVLVLAAFYLLRVIAGTTLIEVERFSPWLYVVTSLFALFIGLGKRRAELVLQTDESGGIRPVLDGYSISLLDQLIIAGAVRHGFLIQTQPMGWGDGLGSGRILFPGQEVENNLSTYGSVRNGPAADTLHQFDSADGASA